MKIRASKVDSHRAEFFPSSDERAVGKGLIGFSHRRCLPRETHFFASLGGSRIGTMQRA